MSSSDPAAAGRRFVVTALCTVVLMLGCLFGATAATDPTGLLVAGGWPAGLCAPGVKVMDDRVRKPAMLSVHRPDGIILGSSRVAGGFDGRGLRPEDGTVLNLGMTGATMTDIDALARRAADETPVSRVWIGLDFGAVAMTEAAPITMPSETWLADPAVEALWHGLLSPTALKATFGLLLHPAACETPPFDVRGFPNPASGSPAAARMAAPDPSARARLLRSWRAPPAQREALYAARMATLDRLLLHLRGRGVEVILYRSPSHPAYHALVDEAGLGPLHRRWQADTDRLAVRRGVTLVAADAPGFLTAEEAPACPGPLVDCAFRDAVHFRPEVGAAILRQGRASRAGR